MQEWTTSKLRNDFSADGYVVYRRLISPEQVAELLVDYERAVTGIIPLKRQDGKAPPGLLRQLAYPVRHIPHWTQHEYFRKTEEIAAELLGVNVRYHEDQILMKPPQCPAETPWHQDAAYWEGEGIGYESAITCWLALSPAFKENGGLQFIAGSHRHGVQPHWQAPHCVEIADALETRADAQLAIAPELAPGDATFHHTRTLHYSSANYSREPRRGLITQYWPTANT